MRSKQYTLLEGFKLTDQSIQVRAHHVRIGVRCGIGKGTMVQSRLTGNSIELSCDMIGTQSAKSVEASSSPKSVQAKTGEGGALNIFLCCLAKLAWRPDDCMVESSKSEVSEWRLSS